MLDLVVKIEGGLGNQLLQYLFGVALSRRHKKDVSFDVSDYFEGRSNRTLALIDLDLPGYFITCDKVLNKSKQLISLGKIQFFGQTRRVGHQTDLVLPFLQELGIGYNDKLEDNAFGYFSGYWQTYRYWQQPTSLLTWLDHQLDRIEVQKYSSTLLATDSNCALHVRRGDYLRAEHINWHGLCESDYYLKAIELFNCDQNIFFSDDINYVDKEYTNVSGYKNASAVANSEIQEFLQLRKFNKLAIGNSSFSYLAGLLASNRNANAVVIAPYPWYSWTNVGPDHHEEWTPVNRVSGKTQPEDDAIADDASVTLLVRELDLFEEGDWNHLFATINANTQKIDQLIILNYIGNKQDSIAVDINRRYPSIEINFSNNNSPEQNLVKLLQNNLSSHLIVFNRGDQFIESGLAQSLQLATRCSANVLFTIDSNKYAQSSNLLFDDDPIVTSSLSLRTLLLKSFFAKTLSILMNKNEFIHNNLACEMEIEKYIHEYICSNKRTLLSSQPIKFKNTYASSCQLDLNVDRLRLSLLIKNIQSNRTEKQIKNELMDYISVKSMVSLDFYEKLFNHDSKINLWVLTMLIWLKIKRQVSTGITKYLQFPRPLK
jgi:hypothetical protein